MQLSTAKRIQYVCFVFSLFLSSSICALAANASRDPCKKPFESQHINFGQLEVNPNHLVIWQSGVQTASQLRLGRLIAETEMIKFVTDSMIDTTEIISNDDLLKSKTVVTNEATIGKFVKHKHFASEALLCSAVFLPQS